MKIRIPLSIAFFVLSLVAVASAQNYRGAIRGRITDQAAVAVSGARLSLTQEETNESRRAASDASGEFALTLLPPGSYRLEVEQSGYKKSVYKITLAVNQERRVDVELEVGTLTDEVIITESLMPLRQDTPALGVVIDNQQITGLPLDGRNFLELSLLVPGAAPSAPGSAGSVRGSFTFNINGTREDSSTFLLDGVYNFDPKLNTIGVRPPVDAVREFEVLSSTYDASFGRSAGAQVNVVLKSGTNRFHGTAYEFIRNRALDARNFFAPPDVDAPQYQRHQFGGSIGGPVIRGRTFIFGDYEGTRLREGLTRVTNVPTELERRGDFSESLFPKPHIPGTDLPFPNHRIPESFQSPVGRRIAALYPLPNRNVPFQNYVSSPVKRDRDDLFDLRLDHALSTSTQLTARYSFTDRDLYEPFSGPGFAALPGFGSFIPRRGQNFMLGATQIFSPAFVNDLRFAYSRVASGVYQESQGRGLNRQVGLPDLSSDPRDDGLSFITITGYSPLGDEYNNPQFSATNTFQLIDTATLTRGRHLVKFGADLRAVQQNAYRDVQARGFLIFSSQVPLSGNGLADLLLGAPWVTGGARLDNHQHLRTESYNFFVNDSFRVRPDLTLSVGLRYEFNSPPVDTEDRANIYDPVTGTLVRVGTNGVPRSGFADDRNNFAPRVGLAWTIGRDQQMVLRAGYGVYYDQASLAPGEGLYFNQPYFDLQTYFQLPGLPLTLENPFPQNFPFRLPASAFTFERDLRTAYVQHWNFGLQRQLGLNRIVELTYVGSKGTKLLAARDINQPRPSPAPGVRRPNPGFEDIIQQQSSANSHYHSLQSRFQQRLQAGLTMLASYTFAKSIDNASGIFTSAGDPNFPQDSDHLEAERGRSNFDLRHRFSTSLAYDLPFGRGRRFLSGTGWATELISGWQTYAVITLQTGRPFTVALPSEFDNSNTGRANLGFGANDRPHLTGETRLSNPTPERWFNTAAFARPPYGSFGSAGRNIVEGPGYQNINFSLAKNTALAEEIDLQFRAEFFNLFNHPNFDLPDNFFGSPTFGQILSAQSPRRIQFGMKLIF